MIILSIVFRKTYHRNSHVFLVFANWFVRSYWTSKISLNCTIIIATIILISNFQITSKWYSMLIPTYFCTIPMTINILTAVPKMANIIKIFSSSYDIIPTITKQNCGKAYSCSCLTISINLWNYRRWITIIIQKLWSWKNFNSNIFSSNYNKIIIFWYTHSFIKIILCKRNNF